MFVYGCVYRDQDDPYGFKGEHCYLREGYGPTLIENIAESLDIRLNHVVTKVTYHSGGTNEENSDPSSLNSSGKENGRSNESGGESTSEVIEILSADDEDDSTRSKHNGSNNPNGSDATDHSQLDDIETKNNPNNPKNDSSKRPGGGGGGVTVRVRISTPRIYPSPHSVVPSPALKNEGEGSENKEVVEYKDFVADQVLVTASLGVLKSGIIEFEPALPAWKTDSIAKLGFGLINKVVLEFEEVFWTNDDHFGCLPADVKQPPGRYYIFWNLHNAMGKASLSLSLARSLIPLCMY